MFEHFGTMNNQELISFVLVNHYVVIKKVAFNVKSKYRRVPLEWEDLFNVFLPKVPFLLRSFSTSYNVAVPVYLGTKALYVMANYARRFITRNQEVMNNYVPYELLCNTQSVVFKSNLLPNKLETPPKLDLTVLTRLETKVFDAYFLHNLSIKNSALALKCSEYTITNATKRIRQKFRNQNQIRNTCLPPE